MYEKEQVEKDSSGGDEVQSERCGKATEFDRVMADSQVNLSESGTIAALLSLHDHPLTSTLLAGQQRAGRAE